MTNLLSRFVQWIQTHGQQRERKPSKKANPEDEKELDRIDQEYEKDMVEDELFDSANDIDLTEDDMDEDE